MSTEIFLSASIFLDFFPLISEYLPLYEKTFRLHTVSKGSIPLELRRKLLQCKKYYRNTSFLKKESDSKAALIERGLRRLVEENKIVSTLIGNRNLIDMDQLYDYLSGKNRS